MAVPFARVVPLSVREGDTVGAIEAKKMEVAITAPPAGVVGRLGDRPRAEKRSMAGIMSC
ncbi:MAG: hypothetical protein EOP24_31605 [Hyphomicrobiales bacterium]|nr:MAG: hypothetical protein EOP24_31605 [Hyphomicrobiales bacterium]